MGRLIRPVTAAEVAATAPIRWREQYRHWNGSDTFADGSTKDDVDEALNTAAHTPENIAKAINAGWAYPECMCCGLRFNAVARLRAEWTDNEIDLCEPCLQSALSMLAGMNTTEAKEAR